MSTQPYEKPLAIFSRFLIAVLVISWWFGLINGWLAIGLFAAYLVLCFQIAKRDPVIQKEAEEFGRKIVDARREREKERIKNALINSVELRRVHREKAD